LKQRIVKDKTHAAMVWEYSFCMYYKGKIKISNNKSLNYNNKSQKKEA